MLLRRPARPPLKRGFNNLQRNRASRPGEIWGRTYFDAADGALRWMTVTSGENA